METTASPKQMKPAKNWQGEQGKPADYGKPYIEKDKKNRPRLATWPIKIAE
jgi:hypothetical protein